MVTVSLRNVALCSRISVKASRLKHQALHQIKAAAVFDGKEDDQHEAVIRRVSVEPDTYM
jgi:hypothetical protein